jgi:hypothetical protein
VSIQVASDCIQKVASAILVGVAGPVLEILAAMAGWRSNLSAGAERADPIDDADAVQRVQLDQRVFYVFGGPPGAGL